jgi:4-hydroxy-4-methyl-2-oxoglutarate aldolase
MQPVVRRLQDRSDRALVEELAGFGVATIHEAMGKRGLMHPRLRTRLSGRKIAGSAVTVLNHPGDNLMVHAALSVCEPGDVLVVATTVPCMCGMIGELLVRQSQVKGIAGIVID